MCLTTPLAQPPAAKWGQDDPKGIEEALKQTFFGDVNHLHIAYAIKEGLGVGEADVEELKKQTFVRMQVSNIKRSVYWHN